MRASRKEKDQAHLLVAFGARVVGDGELIPAEEAQRPPTVILSPPPSQTQRHRWYTLLAVDPDAPGAGAPPDRYYLHWLVVDAQIDAAGHLQQGRSVATYQGPAPPAGTHRYVFLLYQQPQATRSTSATAPVRSRWDLSTYVQDNALQLIATGFFHARRREDHY
jgi:phosphatidylethanolamine-binding protein (PEBP) family uncharacterized protein